MKGVKKTASGAPHKKFGSAKVRGGMGKMKSGALVVSPVKDSFVTRKGM